LLHTSRAKKSALQLIKSFNPSRNTCQVAEEECTFLRFHSLPLQHSQRSALHSTPNLDSPFIAGKAFPSSKAAANAAAALLAAASLGGEKCTASMPPSALPLAWAGGSSGRRHRGMGQLCWLYVTSCTASTCVPGRVLPHASKLRLPRADEHLKSRPRPLQHL
jgi:hypothetical protein